MKKGQQIWLLGAWGFKPFGDDTYERLPMETQTAVFVRKIVGDDFAVVNWNGRDIVISVEAIRDREPPVQETTAFRMSVDYNRLNT